MMYWPTKTILRRPGVVAPIVGQSTLTVTGPTAIYVSGDARLTGGGVVNLNRDPSDLRIYSTGEELDLSSKSGFWGVVIAPDTEVRVSGTPDYYGIIMGRTMEVLGDTNIHVDEGVVDEIFGARSATLTLVE